MALAKQIIKSQHVLASNHKLTHKAQKLVYQGKLGKDTYEWWIKREISLVSFLTTPFMDLKPKILTDS